MVVRKVGHPVDRTAMIDAHRRGRELVVDRNVHPCGVLVVVEAVEEVVEEDLPPLPPPYQTLVEGLNFHVHEEVDHDLLVLENYRQQTDGSWENAP